jgi:DNA-binding NarL/FixJ family response regulator
MLNGIRALLEPAYDVVGTATNGRQLVEAALRLKPDLVVLDVSMPQLNGLEAARQIHEALPSAVLVVLSMHVNPLYLRKAIGAGARGYVLKEGVLEELLDAIEQALAGTIYVSAGFGADVIENLWNSSGQLSREEQGLTGRQREILQLMAEGRLNKEIAHIAGISIKTVEFHRARIMTKLGAHSLAEVVRLAVEQGLIPPSA